MNRHGVIFVRGLFPRLKLGEGVTGQFDEVERRSRFDRYIDIVITRRLQFEGISVWKSPFVVFVMYAAFCLLDWNGIYFIWIIS